MQQRKNACSTNISFGRSEKREFLLDTAKECKAETSQVKAENVMWRKGAQTLYVEANSR